MDSNNQAGYAHSIVKEALKNSVSEPLLRQLSLFNVKSNWEAATPHAVDSISELAVLHNLIIRGLPTLPSCLIENRLNELFQIKGEKSSPIITYNGDDITNEVIIALHIVDNRLVLNKDTFPENDKFGSKFESSVFYKETEEYPAYKQLLQPQVSFDQILQGTRALAKQTVDFAIPLPYSDNKEDSKEAKKGIIIEIDGRKWHSSLSQKLLDKKRDAISGKYNWKTHRIVSQDTAIDSLTPTKEPFIAKTHVHFKKPLSGAWLDILQFTLTPFAVARVQKVIIDAAITGLFPDPQCWKITVVEQDVPCAHLAVQDLQEIMNNLFTLTGKPEQCPIIQLEQVFVTKEFEGCKLQRAQDNITIGPYTSTPCDLVIDVSVLRRTNLEHSYSYPNNYAIIRSSRWPEFSRKIISAPAIHYSGLVTKESDEKWIWSEENAKLKALKFFLQNLFRGKDQFREGQIPILARALQNQTVIGLLPTGGGKSLTYQLAALLQPGVTMIVAPIRSLMKDQVDGLIKNGIDNCHLINSTLSIPERNQALYELATGQCMFSFLSPERFLIEEFRDILSEMNKNRIGFSYCVIDEAHCVSEWGHDFRTSYLSLGKNAMAHCQPFDVSSKVPLIALTATASYDVLADIQRELSVDDNEAIIRSEKNLREEIVYQVVEVPINLAKTILPIHHGGVTHDIIHVSGNEWSIKSAISDAKKEALKKIISECAEKYKQINQPESIENVLSFTWEHLLDDSIKKLDGSDAKQSYVNKSTEQHHYPNYSTEKFWQDNGALIFAPHRSGVFGVTDKFKKKKGTDGKLIPLTEEERKGIADSISVNGFTKAIPENPEAGDLRSYVGTFMGASEESEEMIKRIDKDSFDNQNRFLANELNLMVATKAFGMGIDKPNIRLTVHFNLPGALEGFVQECGRAGRDRKMALSYVLLCKKVLYGFNHSSRRQLKKMGIELNTSLIGKWFEWSDFKQVLALYPVLSEINENSLPGYINVLDIDRGIPQFFFENSFKGVDKEMAMLNELLREINFPDKPDTGSWDQKLEDAGYEGVTTNYSVHPATQEHRIYLNPQHGHLNISGRWSSHFPSSKEMHTELQNIIQQENDNILPSLGDFLSSYTKPSQLGIARLLESINTEDTEEIEIGFCNNLSGTKNLAKKLYQFIKDNITEAVSESRVEQMYEKYPDSFEDFLDEVPTLTHKAEFEENLIGYEEELKALYLARRTKADTDKAIYRLVCAGIVDDYRVDYRYKMYYLTIRKKTIGEYLESVFSYIRRYYSDQRCREIMSKEFGAHVDENQEFRVPFIQCPEIKHGTLLRKTLHYIVTFAYSQIAEKRKNAISDTFNAIEEYLNQEAKNQSGNTALHEYIFLYFNSKYAKKGYEISNDNESSSKNFSLLDDSETATKELSFKRILEYIDIMAKDQSASETDNIKHLRGAASRLLRANPDNASIKLLKGFSLLVLGGQSAVLFDEAQKACREGFTAHENSKNADEKMLAEMVHRYRVHVMKYVPHESREKVNHFLLNLVDSLSLERNLDWLKNFNIQLLTKLTTNN